MKKRDYIQRIKELIENNDLDELNREPIKIMEESESSDEFISNSFQYLYNIHNLLIEYLEKQNKLYMDIEKNYENYMDIFQKIINYEDDIGKLLLLKGKLLLNIINITTDYEDESSENLYDYIEEDSEVDDLTLDILFLCKDRDIRDIFVSLSEAIYVNIIEMAKQLKDNKVTDDRIIELMAKYKNIFNKTYDDLLNSVLEGKFDKF
ncbi:MAG: hypothetical protein ACTSRP_18715 [Candidatus Helarchaeota archaeon]